MAETQSQEFDNATLINAFFSLEYSIFHISCPNLPEIRALLP